MGKLKSTQEKGMPAFDAYYRAIYQSRWNPLLDALAPHEPNKSNYCAIPSLTQHSTKSCSNNPFYIDKASYFAARLAHKIIVQEQSQSILDMCSAPGGKLIALLQLWAGALQNTASIDNVAPLLVSANEKSRNRFIKLQHSLKQYVLQDFASAPLASKLQLEVFCKDGNIYGKNLGKHADKNSGNAENKSQSNVGTRNNNNVDKKHNGEGNSKVFDFIMLDAPCSNDRHVLKQDTELALWSPTRTKRLAIQQLSLLCAAIDCCKNNGIVLYLTCSLSKEENEKVIDRALRKRQIEVLKLSAYSVEDNTCMLEPVSNGHIILPDKSCGAGPLYMCILRKTQD